jgi:hypothetical protein
MRWFWIDGGQQAFGNEKVVSDYVRALGQAFAKVGPEPTLDVAAVGLTDGQKKQRNELYYKWRDAMLVAANDIATPLQPDAWRTIDAKWIDYNKRFK